MRQDPAQRAGIKAHVLLDHSTLGLRAYLGPGSRVIKKKKEGEKEIERIRLP